MQDPESRLPPIWLSLVPVIVLVTMLFFSVFAFGVDTLSGASQLTLLVSAGVTSAIGIRRKTEVKSAEAGS